MFKNLSFIGLYVVCQGVHDIEGVSPISDHEMGQPDFLQGFPGAPGYWQGHFPNPDKIVIKLINAYLGWNFWLMQVRGKIERKIGFVKTTFSILKMVVNKKCKKLVRIKNKITNKNINISLYIFYYL